MCAPERLASIGIPHHLFWMQGYTPLKEQLHLTLHIGVVDLLSVKVMTIFVPLLLRCLPC